jgi:thiol-disulfide isomerase/thioredoxin
MKVLKFGAIWCTECLVMKPMWKEIEEEISGFDAEYFDADNDNEMLEKYNVENIPVFIFLDKDEKEILRLQGVQNKDDLICAVQENLDK